MVAAWWDFVMWGICRKAIIIIIIILIGIVIIVITNHNQRRYTNPNQYIDQHLICQQKSLDSALTNL